MAVPIRLMEELLALSPEQKAEVIKELTQNLYPIDPELDEYWKIEVEKRIEAYERGEMKAISMEEVFGKYKKQ